MIENGSNFFIYFTWYPYEHTLFFSRGSVNQRLKRFTCLKESRASFNHTQTSRISIGGCTPAVYGFEGYWRISAEYIRNHNFTI